MNYDFAAIEKKWQANWEKTKPYAAITGDKRPKFYGLIEFPYPSGQGLHVGHPRPFTAMDIVTRKKRMQGYNVLFPIGFDAFGLPTENYAIKNHIHPAIVTKNNIENFTKQLKMLGYGFDWDRCVDTTDPKYYKWTQWIFLQMFKHGLAYKSTMPVNWCTSCKCVLANEEVVNGVCERCGSEVIRKEKSQWMLKITEYAQRLIDDLDDVDYIERVKIQQRNWIGRSTGAEITFDTNVGDQVTVYTTRADTLFGTTYMVISPEHPLLKKWQPLIKNWDAVAAYQEEAAHKSDFERGELNKEKTGVRLEGDAVRGLTLIFLELWGATQKAAPEVERYLSDVPYTARENAVVLPYADNPLDDEATGENVYLNMIRSAKDYVYITTPYLILSDEMQRTLRLAASSGVDVRIITPGIPDKKLIFSVTRSYYASLAKSGVRIYEYAPGFIHAKQCVADGTEAVVGTINFDFRSLYLHFENACWFCGCSAVADVRRDFDALFPVCREVTQKYADTRSLAVRGWDCVLRLFSPLM